MIEKFRRIKLKNALNWPIYPYLLFGWLILALFYFNITELPPYELLQTLSLVTIMGFILNTLVKKTVDYNSYKSALATSFIGLAILTYGYVRGILDLLPLNLSSHLPLIALVVVIVIALTTWLRRTDYDLTQVTKILNIVGITMVLYNTLLIASYYMNNKTALPIETSEGVTYKQEKEAKKPNIYYFILDTYPSNKTLRTIYNFDNTKMVGFLEKKSFQVFDDAYSNYQFTSHSLASTLNMRYLDNEMTELNHKSNSLIPLYNLINESQAIKEFRELGYRVINASSRWGPTRTFELADKNYDEAISYTLFNLDFTPSEFKSIILRNSVLGPILDLGLKFNNFVVFGNSLNNGNSTSREELHAKTFEAQIDNLSGSILSEPGPKFVLAHILMPHVPYIYAPNGERVIYSDEVPMGERLLNQLQFGNTQLMGTINNILSNDSEAILIIQADEGPYPEGTVRDDRFDWSTLSASQLQEKFGIISAYRLPGLKLNQKPTPANTFRIILREYFGSDLDLLDDRQYIFKNQIEPYNFNDISGNRPFVTN